MTAAMLSIAADAAELNTNLINIANNKSSFANLTTQMVPLINSTILSASAFPSSVLPSKNDNTQTRITQTSNGTAVTPRKVTTISSLSTRTTTIIMNSKRPTIIIYPTVSPESIVIPIVSCILGFPLLALLVICCLRRRAKLARERDRRRNYDMQDHAVSLVRFSPIHRLSESILSKEATNKILFNNFRNPQLLLIVVVLHLANSCLLYICMYMYVRHLISTSVIFRIFQHNIYKLKDMAQLYVLFDLQRKE